MAFKRTSLEHLDFPFEKTRFHQNLIKNFLSKELLIKEVNIAEHPTNGSNIGWDYSSTVVAALPAFNEETSIAKLIPKIKPVVDMVIVVDDGSTDATATIAQQMGAFTIRHTKNRGYGAALQTIFSTARDLNVDALVILDADGQHDPDDIEKVLKPLLNGADVVIGSRFLRSTKKNIPRYRELGMKVLNIATATAGSGKGLDTQSGFRAYGKKAIRVINFSGTGMSAGSEILLQIKDNNLKVEQVPINVHYDIENTSTQNPVKHGLLVLYKIIGLISYRRPLPAFGIPGSMLFFTGAVFGLMAFSEYYTTTRFPLVDSMLSMVLVMTGILLLVAALILNYLVLFVTDQKKSHIK